MQTRIVLALASALTLGPLPALAEGLYFGASGGYANVSVPSDAIALHANVGTTLQKNAGDGAFGLLMGYQFNQYLAAEAGLVDFGVEGGKRSLDPPFFGYGQGSFRSYGVSLDAVGRYPLTPNLSLLGRLGALESTSEDSRSAGGEVFLYDAQRVHTSNLAVHYGVGLEYAFDAHWAVRGDLQGSTLKWNNNGQPDIVYALASLIYRF